MRIRYIPRPRECLKIIITQEAQEYEGRKKRKERGPELGRGEGAGEKREKKKYILSNYTYLQQIRILLNTFPLFSSQGWLAETFCPRVRKSLFLSLSYNPESPHQPSTSSLVLTICSGFISPPAPHLSNSGQVFQVPPALLPTFPLPTTSSHSALRATKLVSVAGVGSLASPSFRKARLISHQVIL